MTAQVFQPMTLRGLTVRNRVWVSPMCMYSCDGGTATDFHTVHYGQFALGGAGMIVIEATGVAPEGRITANCLGMFTQAHVDALSPAIAFAKAHGAAVAIQLANAGRKASAKAPHQGPGIVGLDDGGWVPVGPTDEPFPGLASPRAATTADIEGVIDAFAGAARRAVAAGVDAIEIHGAHGYLLHQFCSPLVNTRTDEWGGSFDNRTRLSVCVARAIRAVIPDEMPLMYRVSATDYVEGGWTVEDSARLSILLKAAGVDLIDVSSGGAVANVQIPVGPGYQVPSAAHIRREAAIATSAVGLITEAAQAEAVLADGAADAVMVARGWLRDPHLALTWAQDLGEDITWPREYARGRV